MEILRTRINQKIQSSSKEIILGFYSTMLKTHNDIDCDCEYCFLKSKYVSCKIQRTKLQRESTYNFYQDSSINDIALLYLNYQIKELKNKKDNLIKDYT